jgi:hypothetical protein
VTLAKFGNRTLPVVPKGKSIRIKRNLVVVEAHALQLILLVILNKY